MSSDTDHDDGSGRTPGVGRLLTLTDGVVAIAITLLVLQLTVPARSLVPDPQSASQLGAQLARESDRYLSYGIAFYVIAHFWLVHHQVFGRIKSHRVGLAWWNFAFLITITVMPFTSSLLGEYDSNPLAVDIFALNLLLASLATEATLAYGRRKDLLTQRDDAPTRRSEQAVWAATILIISSSAVVAWASTSLAQYCWILLAVLPWAVERQFGRRKRDGTGELSSSTGSMAES